MQRGGCGKEREKRGRRSKVGEGRRVCRGGKGRTEKGIYEMRKKGIGNEGENTGVEDLERDEGVSRERSEGRAADKTRKERK